MGYIHCCGRLVKSAVFVLNAIDGFIESRLFVADSCPHCNSYITVLIRTDYKGHTDTIRKSNLKARGFFEKLQPSILFKEKTPFSAITAKGKNYLNYSYFGSIQKCHSNLSTLKCGLSDPLSHLDVVDKMKNKGLIAI